MNIRIDQITTFSFIYNENILYMTKRKLLSKIPATQSCGNPATSSRGLTKIYGRASALQLFEKDPQHITNGRTKNI